MSEHPAVIAAAIAMGVGSPDIPQFTNWPAIVKILETLPRVRFPGKSFQEEIRRYVVLCAEDQDDDSLYNLTGSGPHRSIPEIAYMAIVACCLGVVKTYESPDWHGDVIQTVSVGPYTGWDNDGDQCAVLYLGDCPMQSGLHHYIVPDFS